MQFDLVRRFGTRVHEVEGLVEPFVYCPGLDVAFVRAGLDEEDRRQVAEQVLAWALADQLGHWVP